MQSHRLWEVELATAAQERCERVRRCDQVEPRCAEQRARGRAAGDAGGADRPPGGPEAARQLVPNEARTQRHSEAIRGHPRPSEVIRCHQRSSEVIMCSRPPGAHTGAQTQSDALRRNQTQPDAIRRNQTQSDALKPHDWTTVGGERWLMRSAADTALQLPNLGGGERGGGVLGRTRQSKVRAERGRGRTDPTAAEPAALEVRLALVARVEREGGPP